MERGGGRRRGETGRIAARAVQAEPETGAPSGPEEPPGAPHDPPATFAELVRAARALDASDIHLVAGLAPAIRAGGEIIMLRAAPIDREAMRRLIHGLLTEEQLAQLERTRELCFSIFDADNGRIRVTIYFQAGCPEMSVRLCTHRIPTSKELGLPPAIDELARKPNGLVLIAGPTGSGKTTTLSYMIDLINRERRCKIVMIEDPVEYVHRSQRSIIVQQEVYTDTTSFPRALIHVLRQNPDVIAIGEMRELEAISTALTAAETGHLVLATVHTPSTIQTIERVTAVFPAGQQEQVNVQLANSLQGIITQTLVPRPDKQGRVLAYEVLIFNAAVRNLIRENKMHMIQNVVDTNRKDGMISMDQCLLELYQKGLITYDAALARARDATRFAARGPARGEGGGAQGR